MKKAWKWLKGKKRIIGIVIYGVGEALPLWPPAAPASLLVKVVGGWIAGVGVIDVVVGHLKGKKGKD